MAVAGSEIKFSSRDSWHAIVEETRSKSFMVLESPLRRKNGTMLPEVNVKHTEQAEKEYLVVVSRGPTVPTQMVWRSRQVTEVYVRSGRKQSATNVGN